MNSKLYREWLHEFDKKMQRQKRDVLMFVDNAPGHPKDVPLKNTKVIFLPANTTSELQPLDQGIIQNVKQHYKKRILRAIIAKAENDEQQKGDGKFVTVLDAAQWIGAAVKDVKPSTVTSCFKKAGFPCEPSEDDPEDDIPLSQLITTASQHLNIENPMSAEEFTNADDEAPSTEELDNDWEDRLIQDFVIGDRTTDNCDESNHEALDIVQDREPECSIKNTSDALQWANQLKLFVLNKGLTDGK